MSSPTADETKLQDDIDSLNAQITKQGGVVRTLKKDGASADAIAEAVAALQQLKISADTMQKQQVSTTINAFNRKSFDDLMLRKMFIVSSFEIHGGVKGLYDLGPPSCSLKVNTYILSKLYILEEKVKTRVSFFSLLDFIFLHFCFCLNRKKSRTKNNVTRTLI